MSMAAMLHWAAVFFIIAIVGALFGFTGVLHGACAEYARLTFFIAIITFTVALSGYALRKGP